MLAPNSPMTRLALRRRHSSGVASAACMYLRVTRWDGGVSGGVGERWGRGGGEVWMGWGGVRAGWVRQAGEESLGRGRQRAGRSPRAVEGLVPPEVRVAEDMHVRPHGAHSATEGQRAHRLHGVGHGVVRGVVHSVVRGVVHSVVCGAVGVGERP